MFNFNQLDGSTRGASTASDFDHGTQSTFHTDTDYFGPRSDWYLYGAENVQSAQSSMSSASQAYNATGTCPETPILPDDGTFGMNQLGPKSSPGLEAKVRLPTLYPSAGNFGLIKDFCAREELKIVIRKEHLGSGRQTTSPLVGTIGSLRLCLPFSSTIFSCTLFSRNYSVYSGKHVSLAKH